MYFLREIRRARRTRTLLAVVVACAISSFSGAIPALAGGCCSGSATTDVAFTQIDANLHADQDQAPTNDETGDEQQPDELQEHDLPRQTPRFQRDNSQQYRDRERRPSNAYFHRPAETDDADSTHDPAMKILQGLQQRNKTVTKDHVRLAALAAGLQMTALDRLAAQILHPTSLAEGDETADEMDLSLYITLGDLADMIHESGPQSEEQIREKHERIADSIDLESFRKAAVEAFGPCVAGWQSIYCDAAVAGIRSIHDAAQQRLVHTAMDGEEPLAISNALRKLQDHASASIRALRDEQVPAQQTRGGDQRRSNQESFEAHAESHGSRSDTNPQLCDQDGHESDSNLSNSPPDSTLTPFMREALRARDGSDDDAPADAAADRGPSLQEQSEALHNALNQILSQFRAQVNEIAPPRAGR